MSELPLSIGTMHFTGIGGIGMSGIAEILFELGYNVQGSDMSENANVRRLRAKGINVITGVCVSFLFGKCTRVCFCLANAHKCGSVWQMHTSVFLFGKCT